MKIEFFKKKNKFTKKSPENKINFYWRCILLITFILIIFSFIFSFFLFKEVSESLDLPSENRNNKDLIKREEINSTLKYFQDKEKKSKEILNSSVFVVDPSL